MKVLKALIIEDGEVQLRAYSELLKKAGFRTYFARYSEEAFRVLQEQEIDFILCDLHLERKNGIEESGANVIAKIRKLPGYETTEIMAYTADPSTKNLMAALDAGADDAYSKMVGARVLERKFEKVKKRFDVDKEKVHVAEPEQQYDDDLVSTFEEYEPWINAAVKTSKVVKSKWTPKIVITSIILAIAAYFVFEDPITSLVWHKYSQMQVQKPAPLPDGQVVDQ